MKKQVFILALVTMVCSGCTLARIFTYVPEPTNVTTVQVAAQPVVVQQPVATTTIYTQGSTKTVNVMSNATWDMSRYLDLNAVAAAFAQSATIRDFELLLNTSRYMLSNLDLNGDGYVDYIRVLETQRGYTHVLLLQAVVGLNLYQDVATIVAESTPGRTYVQVIGAQYIYGTGYIVEPVFVQTPPIYAHWNNHPNYVVYSSPYGWNNFPTCYRQPQPVYISHYQAYVGSYMQNHHYCHEVKPVQEVRYQDYGRLTQSVRRDDYAREHPEKSFSSRTGSGVRNTTATRPQATQTTQTTQATRDTQTKPVSMLEPANARGIEEPAMQIVQTKDKPATRQPAARTAPATTTSTRVTSTGTTTRTTRTGSSSARTTTIRR